ncbi:Protein CL16A [Blomia tropicalis]|nr:Protein CL16A [Blomia tropicalis]
MFRPSRWFGWNRSNGSPMLTASTSSTSTSSPNINSFDGQTSTINNDLDQTSSSSSVIQHSLEQLKTLYSQLEKNPVVNENNRTELVETLRQIAEILIWGDQNDSTVFDFFLEKNMLYCFLRIMKQPESGTYVCTQLLQTLNILFENIRNETSLYYLLSNNHVNSIIEHRFQFDDEEVMAYYISFLKTLSMKLNIHTVHFFFNEHTSDFPLYTEALKFFAHPEKMVRIAVRTLTLNVYHVRENSMLRFIRNCTVEPYFSNLVWFISSHVIEIDRCLKTYHKSWQSSAREGQNQLIRLEDLLAEHHDHLHYLNDVLLLNNIDDLNLVLIDNLLHRLVVPLYLHSFLSISESDSATEKLLSTPCALYLLMQTFFIFTHRPLLNRLINIILRSTRIQIELNMKRCQIDRPTETLEESINRLSTQSITMSNDDNDDDDDSKKKKSSSSPFGSPAKLTLETFEPSVEDITIRNWSEFPFLIAILSNLNSDIIGNIGNQQLSSCHSTTVINHLTNRTITDDRTILLTLSLLASILSNSSIDCSYYHGILVPPSSNCSASDSESFNSYCCTLINSLLLIMRRSNNMSQINTNPSIRIVTFELAIWLFKRIVFYYHHQQNQTQCPIETPLFLSDHQFALLEQAIEDSAYIVRQSYRSTEESIFLLIFEKESEITYRWRSECRPITFETNKWIWSHDPNLSLEQMASDCTMMCPTIEQQSDQQNIDFRLPINEYERIRYGIKIFFILKRLSYDIKLMGTDEHKAMEMTENTIIANNNDNLDYQLKSLMETTETIQLGIDQFIDLSLCHINSCTTRLFVLNSNNCNQTRIYSSLFGIPMGGANRRQYSSNSGSRTDSPIVMGSTRRVTRFMVITNEHLLLVEPDTKRCGWGVIRFMARLLDLEQWSIEYAHTQSTNPPIPDRKEREDQQSIYIHFRRFQSSISIFDTSSSTRSSTAPIVIRFTFDDQIRQYAAEKELKISQTKLMRHKQSIVQSMIGLSGETQSEFSTTTARSTTSRPSSSRSTSMYTKHQLLSRTLAVPGGAVLSARVLHTELNDGSFRANTIRTGSKHRAGSKITKQTDDGGGKVNKTKKLRNPKELSDHIAMIQTNDDRVGIPLENLSPKTTRRSKTMEQQEQSASTSKRAEDGSEDATINNCNMEEDS